MRAAVRSGIPQPSPSDADLLRAFVALAAELDDGEACVIDAETHECLVHSGGTPCEIATLRLLIRAIHARLRPGLHRVTPGPIGPICEVCYDESWPCPTERLRDLGILPDRGATHG